MIIKKFQNKAKKLKCSIKVILSQSYEINNTRPYFVLTTLFRLKMRIVLINLFLKEMPKQHITFTMK